MKIVQTVQKARKSKDGKILMANFLSLSVLQVTVYIFPLITLPYLARVIGVDTFGEIAFASAIIMYFQTIVDWGFNFTATRDIARNRNNIHKISEIFCNVIGAKLLLLLGCTIIFTICIYFIPYLFEKRLLLWITYLYIPGHILFPDWFFQAMEKMKYITIMNVFSKLLFTVLVFLVIKNKEDYIFQPLLVALGFFMSGCISLWFVFHKFNIQFIFPSLLNIRNHIRNSWNMFISLLLPNLYTNFSVILLGAYGENIATGIYSGGKKFIDLSDQFMQVLSRTFFPFLARRIDKHHLYVKISGTISIVMGIVLFISSNLIVKIFYTDEFSSSSTVIRIMAISPFFLFLMNTYGINYLVLKNKENILRNIILYCSIGGFLFAWAAVTQFGYIGVAITITSVWGIRGLLTWFYATRESRKS
jgi:PST family polysaccharide transporter